MKQNDCDFEKYGSDQPPSGGCVLKHGFDAFVDVNISTQPPSGGCVLKRTVCPL